MHKNPQWRGGAADALRGWVDPFWRSLCLGIATDVIRLELGRLYTGTHVGGPRTDFEKDLRRRTRSLGQAIAKERDDAARGLTFGVRVSR